MLNITQECGVAGYYTFLLNGESIFSKETKNLITDFGWSRLLQLGKQINTSTVLQVGTGNTPPAVTDTALASFLAQIAGKSSSGVVVSGTDVNGAYSGVRCTYEFAQGTVIGNLTEVGLKIASADTSLTSRSLIKDGSGNPTTLTVTAIDQLTVLYELRYYYNDSMTSSGTMTIGGVSTNWAVLSAGRTAYNQASFFSGRAHSYFVTTVYGTGVTFGAAGTDPSGGASSAVSKSGSTSVNVGTSTATYTITAYTISEANVSGGILAILIDPQVDATLASPAHNRIKISFSPAVAKTSTKTFGISYSVTYFRY